MDGDMPAGLVLWQQERLLAQLRDGNQRTAQFGLTLSQTDAVMLAEKRFAALQMNGRVEFGEGILPKLAQVFCDSPYMHQQNFAETLAELQDLFYALKGEALEMISDDALLGFMRRRFDTDCKGSVSALGDLTSEELCRRVRFGEVLEAELEQEPDVELHEDPDEVQPWDS